MWSVCACVLTLVQLAFRQRSNFYGCLRCSRAVWNVCVCVCALTAVVQLSQVSDGHRPNLWSRKALRLPRKARVLKRSVVRMTAKITAHTFNHNTQTHPYTHLKSLPGCIRGGENGENVVVVSVDIGDHSKILHALQHFKHTYDRTTQTRVGLVYFSLSGIVWRLKKRKRWMAGFCMCHSALWA